MLGGFDKGACEARVRGIFGTRCHYPAQWEVAGDRLCYWHSQIALGTMDPSIPQTGTSKA